MRSMRVTVCFGQTRVIVPCKGGATVAELVKEACARYKKAIGKGPKYWVKIRQLENAVDGGILDVDDYVYDVAEDRDQLIAVFDEEDDQSYRYNGWDRQSGSSSDGHRSPTYHHHPAVSSGYSNDNKALNGNQNRPQAASGNAVVIKHTEHEVNVGVDALNSGSLSHITVRTGGDHMLNKAEGKECKKMPNPVNQNTNSTREHRQYYGRRESGSGQEEDHMPPSSRSGHRHRHVMTSSSSLTNSSPERNVSVVTTSSDASNSVDGGSHTSRKKHDSGNYSNFVRDTTRQSIMGMLAEKHEDETEEKRTNFRNDTRQPPDGRKGNSDYEDFNGIYRTKAYNVERYLPPPPNTNAKVPAFYNDSQEMFVEIDDRPLGVQVVSYRDNKVFSGLLVKSVDEGGRSEREGLLQQGDVIVEINHYILAQYSLSVAQEIFKNAMKFPELQLRVYPVEEKERAEHEKSEEMNNALNRHRHTPSIPLLSVVEATPPKPSRLSSAKSLPNLNDPFSSKSAQGSDVSPDGKVPLAARMSLDTLSNNTRKIGNMFEIELRKGGQGLGFSITTRDTPVGDPGPIYIKNILPKGAAIQDGRLQAGDRLLKVNDIQMTGHTQESAVNILRCIDVGSIVRLVVSRHVNTLPRKLKDDPATDKVLSDDSHREYFMFEIALNDTGSAGLGISLKGNQSKKTKRDLGIFVKSVFHGGAAYQDGRLRPNDQLISINGQSLIGMTNHEAIDTLRTSMSTDGNVRGMIQMVIARRKLSSGGPTSPQFSSEASSELSDSLMNERNSRSSSRAGGRHGRQASVPSMRSRALSPNPGWEPVGGRGHHEKHISEVSFSSSVFSTSLGDDANWLDNDESLQDEIQSYMEVGPGSKTFPEDGREIRPRSSRALFSPSGKPTKASAFLRRHSSLRTHKNVSDQNHFANTINRYTQSTPVQSQQPYRNLIGDLMRSAAVDNHYKPRPLPRSTTPNPNSRYVWNAVSTSRKPPTRSHSMRGRRAKEIYEVPRTLPKTRHSSDRTSGVGCAFPHDERSAFDNMTAFEITGHSRDDYHEDESFQYTEEVPRQIDPSPLDPYGNGSYGSSSPDRKDGWPPSPDPQDSDLDPFSRESIFRQSISEKRRGATARDAQSTDTFKAIKNKQTEIEKKKPVQEVKRSTTPVSPLKWVKPSSAKNHNSASSTPASAVRSVPTRSPDTLRRNQNNSSNLPPTKTRPKAASVDEGRIQEPRRSHTPLSFDYRSATPSTLSLASIGSPLSSSKISISNSSIGPPSNPSLPDTPKSSKNPVKQTHSDNLKATKAIPIVKKSNSSESLVTFGIYSKQVPATPISGSPTPSPARDAGSRGVPYLKPPARPEELARPGIEVGPTLGIAKSSSLESLQTAVENFVDNQSKDMPYPRPKPRVLRGRVLNESFRAALDQSYDMETLADKPMATLKEEGPSLSPLVTSSDDAGPNARSRSDKRRAGKSYKLFGLFRVGKNKRSMSSDRTLDSTSSTSSSPRVSENEAHKRLLEAKREDDFKKHQAETERIQAKAKVMREQQQLRKKDEERYRSREDLVDSNVEERIRAPSVPVTAMQRVNIDPKVSYSEAPSGRRSVDPTAMRSAQPTTFDWHSKKRPTSPVDYGRPSRSARAPDKKTPVGRSKPKATPDYSSLPRQPRLEPKAPGKTPDRSDGVVTQPVGGKHSVRSPTSPSENSLSHSPSGFNNYEFYNKQKPPGPGQRKLPPSPKPTARPATTGPIAAERQGRSSKVGRTLYYDDTDSSVSPSSTLRKGSNGRTPAPNPKPRRPHREPNAFDMSSSGKSFQRMESPEPPPAAHRHSQYLPSTNPPIPSAAKMRNGRGVPGKDKTAFRHSVHVDASGYGSTTDRRTPKVANERKRTDPPNFHWKTQARLKERSEPSDSDSYRTSSPVSSETRERNRNAYKKILQARYNEQQDPGRIVISPPFNL